MDIAAVVGLGNPGGRYEGTRHNLGFRVVEELARRWRLGRWRLQYQALVARRTGGHPLILVKPQTFMNLSGSSVAALCRGERLDPAECLVVVDDVDLPLGQIRLRSKGGSGSHNGLRSLVDSIGEDFPRLRLGIRGEAPWEDLAGYVLAAFDPAEEEMVNALVRRAADCAESAVREGVQRAANRFNTSPEVMASGADQGPPQGS